MSDWDPVIKTPDGEVVNRFSDDRNVREYEDEDVLRELYVEEGLSIREMARRLGASYGVVRRNLHRSSIDVRDKTDLNRSSKVHYMSAVDAADSEEGDTVTGSSSPRVHRVGKRLSKEMTDHAAENSNAAAAEKYGVSERTVERHRSYWTDGEDGGEVSFENVTTVDDRLCGTMRCAARHGDSLSEIADRHGVAKATVQHHISTRTSQPCSHDVDVLVPRVSLRRGGSHGGQSRGDDGRFVSGDADD